MKKFLAILVITFTLISCKKDKENIGDSITKDSTRTSSFDTIQIPSFRNADLNAAFNVAPQIISAEKGKAVFSKDGNALFYFDQNSMLGNIKIDDQNYELNTFDFVENTYKISGPEVSIEAMDGDFPDNNSDCVSGKFSDVKVVKGDKTVNLTGISVMDCPPN